MSTALARLLNDIAALPRPQHRHLVALAGPPAAGKSTLARDLVAALTARGQGAILVPMDGFHLDNAVLDWRGLRARKGAAETFDAAGFVHAMRRLTQEGEVILPDFDRAADLSVAGRIVVGPEHGIAVVEGNYLCCAQAPWHELMPLWSLAAFIDAPDEVLRDRLVRRWLDHGLSPDEAAARAGDNDMRNVAFIRQARIPGVPAL